MNSSFMKPKIARRRKKNECVGKKDGVRVLFFFLVKGNQHVSLGYYLLKKREKV